MPPHEPPIALVTGGTGGIGLHSAIGIAKMGGTVFITGRDVSRGQAARDTIEQATGNTSIVFTQGDLSSIRGIDQLARDVSSRTETLDVLVNNAGFFGDERKETQNGLEMHFAVNVLAPWRLTHVLMPLLKTSANPRVVNVSGGDKPARVDADNLQADKGFRGLMTYAHSKSVLEAMSMFLAKDLEPEGISVNVVFPGRASTQMTQALSAKALPGAMKLMYPFFKLFFRDDGGKSAAKASRSTVFAATHPDVNGITGAYFDTHAKRQDLHPSAYEPGVHARIRTMLENAVALHESNVGAS